MRPNWSSAGITTTHSNYDAYPRILSVALKLTPPNEFFYNILKVKLHYFPALYTG